MRAADRVSGGAYAMGLFTTAMPEVVPLTHSLTEPVADLWAHWVQEEPTGVYPRVVPEDRPAFLALLRLLLDQDAIGLVAQEQGQPIGMALGVVHERPLGQPRVYGLGYLLYVLPAWRRPRRDAPGPRLWAALIEAFRARGVSLIESVVPQASLPHWVRRGWRIRGYYVTLEL